MVNFDQSQTATYLSGYVSNVREVKPHWYKCVCAEIYSHIQLKHKAENAMANQNETAPRPLRKQLRIETNTGIQSLKTSEFEASVVKLPALSTKGCESEHGLLGLRLSDEI